MAPTVGLYLTNQYFPGEDSGAAFEGQLAMVRAARDGGWDAVFAGHHYLGDELAHFQPLPMLARQRPAPPIWMAANSDSAVERAARIADAWLINPHATLETITRQLRLYRAARGVHTGDQRLPLMREIFCAPDRETALRRAAPALGAKYRTYADWGQDKVMPDRDAFDTAYADLAAQRFIVGSPADCVAALRPWLELGVTDLVLRTHWAGMPAEHAVESIRLISSEVLPALR